MLRSIDECNLKGGGREHQPHDDLLSALCFCFVVCMLVVYFGYKRVILNDTTNELF